MSVSHESYKNVVLPTKIGWLIFCNCTLFPYKSGGKHLNNRVLAPLTTWNSHFSGVLISLSFILCFISCCVQLSVQQSWLIQLGIGWEGSWASCLCISPHSCSRAQLLGKGAYNMSADPRYLHFPIEVLQDNTNEPEAAYQISTKIESSRKLKSSYKSLEDLGQRRQRIKKATKTRNWLTDAQRSLEKLP